MSKKVWKTYRYNVNLGEKFSVYRKKAKMNIIKNKDYISPNERPKWCIKKFGKGERCPEFRCLCDHQNKKCPFLALTESDKEDKFMFDWAWSLKTEAPIYNKDGDIDKKMWGFWKSWLDGFWLLLKKLKHNRC